MFCHETRATLDPLSLFLQEALASFDVRAAQGLSHDPMPILDEKNRYVSITSQGRMCDTRKGHTYLDDTKKKKQNVAFSDPIYWFIIDHI